MASSTATETVYTDAFRKAAEEETDPRLRALRETAFAAFKSAGFPTQRQEDWKYTSVAPITKNDWSISPPSRGNEHELGETLRNFALHDLLAGFKFDRNGFTALNLAFADLLVYRIPQGASVDEHITLTADAGTMSTPHILVIAEAGSRATFVEEYWNGANGFTNSAAQFLIKDNANVTHYRVQKASAEAFHYGVTEVTLGRGSRYDSTSINIGGALARHDIDVKFTAEGGEAHVDGLYMLSGTQHSDTHSVIDHTVPNCTSRQNYKGVLNDKSRGVFNGKVFVRENAHGTDAQQSNKNLLLSDDARVDTKPQLEIFNDDVKCAHGATVGQLEEEELFYLLTRGLPERLARNLLTYGFAEEIINKIGVDSIKAELDAAVLNRLKAEI